MNALRRSAPLRKCAYEGPNRRARRGGKIVLGGFEDMPLRSARPPKKPWLIRVIGNLARPFGERGSRVPAVRIWRSIFRRGIERSQPWRVP